MPAATRSSRETVNQLFAVGALYPSRIETTREELRARFQAGILSRRYKSLGDVTIHETAEPQSAPG